MNLSGIIAYPITPFSADGRGINLPVLTQSLELLLASGCHAIAPLGSTGESAYLSEDEWQQVAAHTVTTVAGRVPVVIGLSELTTEGAIGRAKFAESIGADAIMVIPVSYWKLTDQEIHAYYREIAAAVSLPIMVYNNPATSGVDMSPRLIVDMFRDIPNVQWVKESTGDIQRMHAIAELSAGELPFFNGSNPLAFEALCAGASGWCTAAPNVLGDLPRALYEYVYDGNLKAARDLFYRLLPMLRYVVAGGLPKTIKAGLELQSIAAGAPRKPLAAASDEDISELRRLLAAVQ
ncbi:dihydrodipicolinate synthase family protein [Parahaliea mediterranea]|uniref:Dihydrodipicolinate synthase family protein n=1 Tax=Parahaliea mediterranea TaxID=651086 RepID=A0A939DGG4_9GAMM|nr:dihydrodipicolinate synthase family protein [Parahaliea mediterranea]MBN7797619.1 dihydrodipicolinate synthase family protein [Parahaliea mediterranea]